MTLLGLLAGAGVGYALVRAADRYAWRQFMRAFGPRFVHIADTTPPTTCEITAGFGVLPDDPQRDGWSVFTIPAGEEPQP